MDTIRYAPGATFDIFNSLVALETGVVTDEKMPIPVAVPNAPDSNAAAQVNIVEAFKKNNTPATAYITQKIGTAKMQFWIDSIGYGNKNIGEGTANFWQNNTLTISADEQLGFMKRLYFDLLPFRKSVQLSVREMMSQINNSVYAINYKTATVKDKSNNDIQWVTGWIEENRHVYFFTTVLKLKPGGQSNEKTAVDITNNILTHYGFFKGKK
jgi:beta-lactamase class D